MGYIESSVCVGFNLCEGYGYGEMGVICVCSLCFDMFFV